MRFSFQGSVAVVTGGGSGIGQQLVLGLLDRGSKVAAIDISETGLRTTKELAGDKGTFLDSYLVDITDRQAVCDLPKKIEDKFGSINLLINNAGIIQPFMPFHQLEYETIERIMNINVYGPMFMIRSFLPSLMASGRGYIANVSSMGGFMPFPGQTLYGASKAAVKLLTEGLRAELEDSPVSVSVIFPGAVNTNISQNSGVNSFDPGAAKGNGKKGAGDLAISPQKAARVILDGINKRKMRILVGKDAKFMDVLYRLTPKNSSKVISKLMEKVLPPGFRDVSEVHQNGCPF